MRFGAALHYSLKDDCGPCKGTCGTKRLRAVNNDNPIKFRPANYSYEEEIKMHFIIHLYYARKFSDDSTFIKLQNTKINVRRAVIVKSIVQWNRVR